MNSNQDDSVRSVLLMASLPKRDELCAVTVFVKQPPKASQYAKTAYQWLVLKCRMLIFAGDEILSSPVLKSDNRLYIIASKSFLASGKLRELMVHHGLQESTCRSVEVTDAILQACLQYSLKARVAPRWNQVGPAYLVQGRDFLMETAPLSAVKLGVQVQGDQLVLNVSPLRMRLPHLQMADLEVDGWLVQSFLAQHVLSLTSSVIRCNFLHTLPSLRQGRVLSVSHHIPPTCPFLNYREIKRHWKNSYGYRLPDEREGVLGSPAGPYVCISYNNGYRGPSVSYTYPALCVRAQGPILLPNVDQASVVQAFAGELNARLTNLCGLTFQPTMRMGRPQPSLTAACRQGLNSQPANFRALVSLPRGRPPLGSQTSRPPPSQLFSQCSQIHTQSWQPQHAAAVPTLPAPRSLPVRSETVGPQPAALQLAAEVGGSGGPAKTLLVSPPSSSGAAKHHGASAKWDPKPLVRQTPLQDTAITSSKPLYVPIFGKKSKSPGATANSKAPKKDSLEKSNKVIPTKGSNFASPKTAMKTSKVSSCTSVLSCGAGDNLPPVASQKFSTSLTDEPTTPGPLVVPPPRTPKKKLSTSRSDKPGTPRTPGGPPPTPKRKSPGTPRLDGGTPVTKKPRAASQVELPADAIEQLVRERGVEQVSAPLLLKLLRERGVLCKAREKKADLVAKVTQYLGLGLAAND